MSSQIPGGEWYQRCARLEAEVLELKAENERLRKEYVDYIDGRSGSWYIVELKKERDELKRENDRLAEIISYLPKVPTESYEKQMAKEILQLRKTLQLILNAGNAATLGKWDATDEMKDLAYQALDTGG